MINLAQILGGLLGTAINKPEASFLVTEYLDRFSINSPEASRLVGEPVTTPDRQVQYRRSNGVAVMTIDGAMAPRGVATDDRYRWQTYEGINSRLDAIGADDSVHTLLTDLNTPGGYVAGSFSTADKFRNLAKTKRIVALANPMAASAGYLFAAAHPEIVVTPDATVGSMGVLMTHQDWSKFMDMIGVKTTHIFRGAHKVDGNSSEPLTDGALNNFRSEINDIYEQYVARIGSYRPSLGAAGAKNTEARTYFGARAVEAGLADRVSNFDSLLAELSASTARHRAQPGGRRMSNENNQPVVTGISKADHDAAVAAATTAGHAAGRKAAHDRFAAVLADDKVKGKETIALDLALKSPDMAAADVVTFVAALPAAAPAQAGKGQPNISQRMNGQGADLALGGPMGQRSGDDEAQAANQKTLNPSSLYETRRKATAGGNAR